MNKLILYAVYYKHVLASRVVYDKGREQKIPAIFFNYEQAIDWATAMNDSLPGYIVTKIKYKPEKAKVN